MKLILDERIKNFIIYFPQNVLISVSFNLILSSNTIFLVFVIKVYLNPDTSTKCPKDATLYRMSTWDACMTWTLKWGNKVVLQNFVRSDIDCTKSRLKFWSQYIEQVWKEPGKARCCYEVI